MRISQTLRTGPHCRLHGSIVYPRGDAVLNRELKSVTDLWRARLRPRLRPCDASLSPLPPGIPLGGGLKFCYYIFFRGKRAVSAPVAPTGNKATKGPSCSCYLIVTGTRGRELLAMGPGRPALQVGSDPEQTQNPHLGSKSPDGEESGPKRRHNTKQATSPDTSKHGPPTLRRS